MAVCVIYIFLILYIININLYILLVKSLFIQYTVWWYGNHKELNPFLFCCGQYKSFNYPLTWWKSSIKYILSFIILLHTINSCIMSNGSDDLKLVDNYYYLLRIIIIIQGCHLEKLLFRKNLEKSRNWTMSEAIFTQLQAFLF